MITRNFLPRLTVTPVTPVTTVNSVTTVTTVITVTPVVMSSSSEDAMTSLVILELCPTAEKATVDWFVGRLKAPRPAGAGLIVDEAPLFDGGRILLHVGLSREHLEVGAEEMGLRKKRLDTDQIRAFDRKSDSGFEDFTSADKLNVVQHCLRNLRATEIETIPGLPADAKSLYPGKSLCRRLESADVLTQTFPLHEPAPLEALEKGMLFGSGLPFFDNTWPRDGIRNYFGDSIAIYFVFLRYFALALLPVIFVAVPYYLFGGRKDFEAFLFFAIYNLLWATLLMEGWKRLSARRTFEWGTLTLAGSEYEDARAGFHGREMRNHPVTGRREPDVSTGGRYLKMIFVSTPVVLLCMAGAAFCMQLYFYFEDAAVDAFEAEEAEFGTGNSTWTTYVLTYLPSVVYSIVIFLSNAAYRPLAQRLTEYENHRTESEHLNHLVLKILFFDSFNCFGALFYVAFWMQSVKRLRADLASLLVMNQILEQLQETVIPYVSTWRAKRKFSEGVSGGKGDDDQKRLATSFRIDDARVTRAETEADMPPYEGTFDDYLELFLQYGYISLFSCVYPLASIWAFANNLLELRTDSFKFVKVHQRPFPTPASGVGVWQLAFEILGVVAILTNVTLIGMSADFKATFAGVFNQWQIFMLLAFTEHLLVFLKFLVAQVIPDWPEDVRDALHRENYESLEALKESRRDDALEKDKRE